MIQTFHSAVISRKHVGGGGGPALVKFENFETAGGTVDLNTLAGWTTQTGSTNVGNSSGSYAAYPNTSADYSVTYYSSGASSLNQTVDGTLVEPVGGGFFIGVAVRAQSGADSCYLLVSNGTDLVLQKRIAGVITTLVDNTTEGLVDGDKIKLAVTGSGASTRLTVSKDTGGGWTAVSGMSSIDPGNYLASGYGAIAGYGQNFGPPFVDDWSWHND